MPNSNHLKSARQMIDDLINDNPEASKESFHDFLKMKTMQKLNPDMIPHDDVEDDDTSDEDDTDMSDDDTSDEDDTE